ncbi:MAG: hypothetical protein KGH93_01645 [Patescibacteria group bacterium]|nr:hypothetical protein [Patescibacteria group bacterium]MDE1945884.1 hypothetical protein [Patescibacteria group bacterium]
MDILLKKRLFLEGNHLLGTVLYYKDTKGRPCLKFSIKAKMIGDLWVQDKKTGEKKSFLPTPSSEMSGDISYKFKDNLLEIKTEVPGERPRRLMTEVPVPPENYLFLIRLKDWEHLPIETPDENALILAPSWSCKEVVIFTSFAGVEGKPFFPGDEILKAKEGRTITLDLPLEKPFSRIYIGIGEDIGNDEKYPLIIKAPNYRELK